MSAASTVYGPVRSWRVGLSLGIDLLCVDSVCSFRCVYCQLGKINQHTGERRLFVPTRRVIEDLCSSPWAEADAVTFSGSGEPTLASNLGEAIEQVKALTRKPVVVLTNSSLLGLADVRRELCQADSLFCKLDAADERTFRMLNRPVEGLTVRSVIEGIKALRREYGGHLAVQLMLQRVHLNQTALLADALKEIRPDEVQLNLPTRPVPSEWFAEARGNSSLSPFRAVSPKVLPREKVLLFATELRDLTSLDVRTPAGFQA